jgi:hypothetical protein
LDIPIPNEDDYVGGNECDIEQDNGIEELIFPEQQVV